MNPRTFQEFAKELVAKNRPVTLRTAISRAYYATYHVGVALLETLGFIIPQGPGGHGEVPRRLQNSGDADLEVVGRQLENFHRQRIHADYRLDNREVEGVNTARLWVIQAGQLIQRLDACLADQTRRARVKQSIREWERKISRP